MAPSCKRQEHAAGSAQKRRHGFGWLPARGGGTCSLEFDWQTRDGVALRVSRTTSPLKGRLRESHSKGKAQKVVLLTNHQWKLRRQIGSNSNTIGWPKGPARLRTWHSGVTHADLPVYGLSRKSAAPFAQFNRHDADTSRRSSCGWSS